MSTLTVFSVLKRSKELPMALENDLARRAKELLGYGRIMSQSYINDPGPGFTQSVFEDLNIMPFDPRTVEAYKSLKLNAEVKKAKYGSWAWYITTGLYALAGVIGFISIAFLIKFVVFLIFKQIFGVSACLTAILGTFISLYLFSEAHDSEVEYSAVWVRKPIGDVQEDIPEFVIQTACDIKERLPRAKFFIETLVVEQLPRDPFLCMVIGDGDVYYLEVWNEPGFKKTRTV